MSSERSQSKPARGGAGRFWRGEDRLWKAFWLLWVMGWWAVGTIAILIQNSGGLPAYVGPAVIILYMIWAGVGVWRCAFNVGWRGWAYVSRGIVVVVFVMMSVGVAMRIPV